MLIQMRSAVAKVFIYGLFGLLIMSFAVWGIGDIFYGSSRTTVVAEVGDQEIDQREFDRDLGRELNRLQQRIGSRLTLEQASALGVVDQVLQRMITGALFDAQSASMGLVISEQQLKDAIANDPSFRDSTGQFDPNRFTQMLRNNNLSEPGFLALLQRDIRRRQVTDAFVGLRSAPKDLADTVHAYRGEKRSTDTILISLDSLEEPADPDDTTLASYYEENQSSFMAPETRAVSYLSLGPEDVADEIEVIEDDAQAAFEQRREEFIVPERRRIEQIVFGDEQQAAAAMAKLTEGRSFEAVAEETLGSPPVDLGLMTRMELENQLPELTEVAFALAEGQSSEPVSSPFGWHLVRVAEIEAGGETSFAALRETINERLREEMAIEGLISIVNQLNDELAGGASLEEVGASLNLELRSFPAIDIGGNDRDGNPIEDLPAASAFTRTLFETEIGLESLPIDTEDGGYFVLRVDSSTASAVRPLAEVRNKAIGLWKEEERRRLAEEKAKAMAERAKSGATLEQIAEDGGLAVKSLGPFARFDSNPLSGASRELIAELFELEPGSISTASAPEGWFVARLSEIQPLEPGSDQEGAQAIRDQLAEAIGTDLFSAFAESLRQDHPVSVNQSLIQELVSRY